MIKKRFIATAAVALVVAASTVVSAPPAAATPWWSITKIYFDSPGRDTGSNTSVNAEYVIIRNNTTVTHALTGYVLSDASSHRYTFGSYSLTPGAVVYVHTGKGTNSPHVRYWGLGYYIWNNTGDRATLRTGTGSFAASCSYTAANDPVKYC